MTELAAENRLTGMRVVLFFLLAIFCVCEARAQDVDTLRRADTVRYHFTLNSTGSVNQSATGSTLLFNNAARIGALSKRFAVNLSAAYVYGNTDRVLSNNDLSVNADGNLYHHDSKFYYWGLAGYTSSYSLKINSLVQGGAGVAYDFVRRDKEVFNVSDGILFEHDDLYLEDSVRDVYQTFRNSLRVAFKWGVTKQLYLEGGGFLQNSLRNADDYIVKTNLAASFSLTRWLSVSSAFQFNRINRTGKQNLLLTYGLKIERNF